MQSQRHIVWKIPSYFAKWLLAICASLFAIQAMAVDYSFPSKMPSGCSNGGGGVYNCGNITFSFNDTVTISGARPARINIIGKFTTNNVIINQSGSLSDLSIVVTGQTQIDYNASINANITAGSVTGANQAIIYGSITTTTGSINLDYAADVRGGLVSTTGSITLATSTKIASISCTCDVVVGDSSIIAGEVTARTVTDSGAHAMYQGSITTTNLVKLGYGASVSKSIISADMITLDGGSTVAGCVQSTNSKTITLKYADSVQGVCCGTSLCSNSCVANNTGSSMPANCSRLTPLAYYPMDEAAWNGTIGEVAEKINAYNATASSLVSARPSTENISPAISGASGTCGYGSFTRSRKDNLVISNSFPNLGATGQTFTITAWIRTTNNTQTGQRILIDDEGSLGGYGLSLGDGGTGRLRFYTRGTPSSVILDTANVVQNNTWYFVAAVADVPNKTKHIYIYNTSGAQLANVSATWTEASFGSDTGRASIGGETNTSTEANSSFGFSGNIDEVRVYSNALTATEVDTIRQLTHTCPQSSVTPANFNCTIVGGSSNTGHLYTQLAGTAFNVDVVALKADGSVETSYVSSGTKNVTLEFVNGSGATACASRAILNPAISQTVTFSSTDAGRKTVSGINIVKAYRDLVCRVTDANQSPNVVGCSIDDFAVRPSSFSVSTSNANADLASGASASASPVIKAGASFSLTASTGVVGYDGTPSLDTTKLNAHAGAIQAGSLSGAFSAANATTGTATGSSFNYSEVGYFNLATNGIFDSTFTAVDSANGDCATGFTASGGKNACSFGNAASTSYFGRFIPDHFDLTTGVTTPACNISAVNSERFTYLGQDGFTTGFTLRAENLANQITQNYVGSFAKFELNSWSSYTFNTNGLPAGTTVVASAAAPTGVWSNGSASVLAKHVVTRPSTPVAGGNISISITPTDSDGVTMPLTYVSDASLFRYGRLLMQNTYGSELLPLSVPVEAQYWNGNAYQRNQLDICTTIATSSVAMGNYRNNLTACETQISGTGTMSAGKTTFTLSRPSVGNSGSVDLSINLNSANGLTCNNPAQTAASSANIPWFGATNPNARATFGLFKTPIIYMRENF